MVAYNKSFERRCLENMAQLLPAQAAALRDVIARLADPLPVLREHVYHPDFGGGFGLKAVLPALVPELSYDGLEIAGGELASQALLRLMFERESLAAEKLQSQRDALLAYCELDTLAMVKLMAKLRELTST